MQMKKVNFGSTGKQVPAIVMGCMRMKELTVKEAAKLVDAAMAEGVDFFDHADIYGGYLCEAAFGEALKLVPALRDRMEIVTKCGIATTAKPEHALGHYITDSAHIIKSAEQSLVNLATDRIDLLLIHRPDPLMDADEVAEAFLNLGALLTTTKRYGEAEAAFRQALQRHELARREQFIGVTLDNLGMMYRRKGELAAAAAM